MIKILFTIIFLAISYTYGFAAGPDVGEILSSPDTTCSGKWEVYQNILYGLRKNVSIYTFSDNDRLNCSCGGKYGYCYYYDGGEYYGGTTWYNVNIYQITIQKIEQPCGDEINNLTEKCGEDNFYINEDTCNGGCNPIKNNNIGLPSCSF